MLVDISRMVLVSMEESDVLSAGESMTLVDTPWCRLGRSGCSQPYRLSKTLAKWPVSI